MNSVQKVSTCRIVFYAMIMLLIASCRVKNNFDAIADRQIMVEALKNGALANEGFIRCEKYVHAWLEYADPETGLIPRNIDSSKDFWNAQDAAADNYPFMVLTSFFVDKNLFEGTMRMMLDNDEHEDAKYLP